VRGVATAHRLWRDVGFPSIAHIIPAPRDLTAVCELVTAEMVASTATCGPDPHRHLGMVRKYID
jgi:hypothetical protein